VTAPCRRLQTLVRPTLNSAPTTTPPLNTTAVNSREASGRAPNRPHSNLPEAWRRNCPYSTSVAAKGHPPWRGAATTATLRRRTPPKRPPPLEHPQTERPVARPLAIAASSPASPGEPRRTAPSLGGTAALPDLSKNSCLSQPYCPLDLRRPNERVSAAAGAGATCALPCRRRDGAVPSAANAS